MEIVFIALCYLLCLILWIVAECRWSVRVRLSLGIVALLAAIPVTAILALALTDFRNNRYFSEAIKTIVSESVSAMEARDPSLLPRLKKLDSTIQGGMYENKQDLLGKADAFRADGEKTRHGKIRDQPEAPPAN